MLTRCIRAGSLLSFQAQNWTKGFATVKTNYYEILGINNDASIDEIKGAYRTLAKKFHPDVNAGAESYEGNADKFKAVVEAYQVLSIPESRTTYDMQNQTVPDSVFRAQRMEQQRKYADRGKDGNPIQEPPAAGSYAEEKKKYLENERKKFNVDKFGRYKGGVPKKGKHGIRGNAMGPPGAYHDPYLHNTKVDPDPDSQFVTSEDALAFKNYMQEDKYAIQRRGTWFQVKVDYDFFKFETYRYGWRWLRNLFLFTAGIGLISQTIVRAKNRSVAKQVEKLGKEADLHKGVRIEGRLIKQGPTGIIKYAEPSKHQPHH